MVAGLGAVDRPVADVGRFIWAVASDQWQWSDTLYAVHGYRSADPPATTALWLQHKHSCSRRDAEAQLAAARLNPDPFSHYHRIVTVDGREKTVLSVHHGVVDGSGQRVARRIGFLVDVSEDERGAVRDALQQLVKHRAEVEQAKGMLMLAYQLDADQAFAVLRWHSNQHNIKLSLLARRLVAVVGHGATSSAPTRAALDQLLFDLSRFAQLPASEARSLIAIADSV